MSGPSCGECGGSINLPISHAQNCSAGPHWRWVLVCGGPSTGKTTLAQKIATDLGAHGVVGTDSFLALPRGDRPFAAADKMRAEWERGPLIVVEGCEAPRLLDRLPVLDFPAPFRTVWVGPRRVSSYGARHRALVSMQINKIYGAIQIGLLTEFDLLTNEGNLLYVPSQNRT